jgi:hypothetical protein
VIFANNLASAGAIRLQMSDGKELRSHVLGLSYYDNATGKSVLIAEVKDSQGQLFPPNVVVYPDAFTDFKADVRYTYTKAGFEQDIVLQERPPLPEDYGLNSASTVLEVLTEFISPPKPGIRSDTVHSRKGEPLADESLDFGTMHIGRGRAFLIGDSDPGVIPVCKQWTKMEGRTFLIEQVQLTDVGEDLDQLPHPPQANLKPMNGSVRHVVSNQRQMLSRLPEPKLARVNSEAMKVAQQTYPSGGLVLDYATVTTQTNFNFLGETTYYISGTVNLYGTNTFEGGTVIKYDTNGVLLVTIGSSAAKINWLASVYRPVVFTAKDDNSVGEPIGGSTGTPSGYYGNPALGIVSASVDPSISYFRVAYARQAIQLTGTSPVLYHGQIVNCLNGVTSSGSISSFRNILFANVQTNFNNLSAGQTLQVQNGTFSASSCLVTFSSTNGDSLVFTNCILAGVTNLSPAPGLLSGSYNGFYNSPSFGTVSNSSSTYPFQSVGGGSYYLAAGSSFLNKGTTNINATLLTALTQKTTVPPIAYTNVTFTTAQTFTNSATRDTDTPDLGYHYDPLDYNFGGCTANSNVTFTAGTVAGWFRTTSGYNHVGHGIHLGDTTTAAFNGTATQPTAWVRINTAQEADKTAGVCSGGMTGWAATPANAPTIKAQFTICSMLAGDANNHFADDNGWLNVQATHCQFSDGGTGGYMTYVYLTNCLFQDGSLWISQSVSTSASMTVRNCTVHNASVHFAHGESGSPYYFTSIRDSAFDGTSINTEYHGVPASWDYNYNAFTNGASRLVPNGANDVIVSNSFNWQTNWLGTYYLPTNSPLINAGSMTNAALVGLYHFTTQTNQVKEANTPLDIGYHYVATDANGNPLDSNGNGTPDYLEDVSGSGQNWIVLIAPLNNAYYAEPATVPLQASLLDWSGAVTNVEFYRSPIAIAGVPSSPYQYTWPIVAHGQYALTAVSFDVNGLSLTSAPVNITVTNLCGY